MTRLATIGRVEILTHNDSGYTVAGYERGTDGTPECVEGDPTPESDALAAQVFARRDERRERIATHAPPMPRGDDGWRGPYTSRPWPTPDPGWGDLAARRAWIDAGEQLDAACEVRNAAAWAYAYADALIAALDGAP